MSFNCRQCGICCRDLLQKDAGILRGLTLLPKETVEFDEEQVKPYLGYGKHPYETEFKILAYQLNVEECPHLTEDKCSIYPRRPSTCRQFPFSLDPDKEEGVLLGVDMNCPAAVDLVNTSGGMLDFPDKGSAMEIYKLKKLVTDNPRKVWLYDLGSGKWVRYDKLD
jgi:Fe-S-cluster containining protein